MRNRDLFIGAIVSHEFRPVIVKGVSGSTATVITFDKGELLCRIAELEQIKVTPELLLALGGDVDTDVEMGEECYLLSLTDTVGIVYYDDASALIYFKGYMNKGIPVVADTVDKLQMLGKAIAGEDIQVDLLVDVISQVWWV